MATCLLDITDGHDVDSIGVQSHMKENLNADAIKWRFDELSSRGHPLWATEFDTKQPDIDERALDLEDFMRMTYSHPKVVGNLLWYYSMQTTPWGIAEFQHQNFFEGVLNDLSAPYATANNGEPYPLYPNKAGMMWMKLVKEDWTSNENISLSDLENQLLSRKFSTEISRLV